jgi:prolipoprotein diacylglyceryl transferase
MRDFIPTPEVSYFNVGPFTIHFYAICIVLGIIAAISVARKRSLENADLITEISIYAIPSGIIGARIYHVITSPKMYFNHNFLDAFRIWEGGLGIWGAIAGGFAACAIALKRTGKSGQLFVLADAIAPGLLLAQAIGRIGNWFNGELFGRPTNLPWGLVIPIAKRPAQYLDRQTFHPTFLYEAIWCLIVGYILARLKNCKTGQIFWLYVSLYSFGRLFIEMIRSDYAQLIMGIRINVWVAFLMTIFGAWQFIRIQIKR